MAGAAGAALPVGVLTSTSAMAAGSLTKGDADVLRFLAAAEILESDLWVQYSELGGVASAEHPTFGGNPAYILALQNIDSDMPQYITDNTDDELSHAAFINAYLVAHGAQPVDLERFRALQGSAATGAQHVKRLTNLKALNVDTSFYTRYRSDENPDLGDVFGQPLTIKNQPAIPLSDADTPPGQPQPVPPANNQESRMQAIANTASWHFAMIEQGGSSLYTTMALKVTSLEVLRIVVSIGGTEVDHFAIWHDKLGNTVAQPLAGVTDPETGLTFPDFNDATKFPNQELFQTNKIMPEPCDFLSEGFPACSIIRPSTVQHSGAVAAVNALTADELFKGQSDRFFDTIMRLAEAADAAQREVP